MKIIIRFSILVALIGLSLSTIAQDKQWVAKSLGSVVYVQQQYYLDAAKAKRPELWKKLSDWSKKELLGQFLTVSTGSGFFIDAQGHILTNAHVVLVEDANATRQSLITALQKTISQTVPEEAINSDDKFALRADVAGVLKEAHLRLRIWAPGLGLSEATQNAIDKKNDLALISIAAAAPTKALPLAAAKSYPVGSEVYSIGFPLGSLFDEMFSSPQASLSTGVISALRDDAWGIQHTASLNPGNSGGSLLNAKGEVIGVNVGQISNSSGLFFAIPVPFVITFLTGNGFASILGANGEIARKDTESDQDSYEVGDTVVIISEKGATVSQGGFVLGTAPLVYLMTAKTVTLSLAGKGGARTVVLKKKEGLADTITLNLELRPLQYVVHIASEPLGAVVSIDGKASGVSPLEIELPAGQHKVSYFMEGYKFPDQVVAAAAGSKAEAYSRGARVYSFTFLKGLPPGTTVKVAGASESYQVVDPLKLSLPEGRWELEFSDPGILKTTKIVIDAKIASGVIDDSSWFEGAKIVLKGDVDEGKITIDGEPAQPIPKDANVAVSAGIAHKILVERPKYSPYFDTVELKAGETKVLNMPNLLLPAVKKKRDIIVSSAMTAAGLVMIGGAVYCAFRVADDLNRTGSSKGDDGLIEAQYALGWGGMGLSLWGGIKLVIALNE